MASTKPWKSCPVSGLNLCAWTQVELGTVANREVVAALLRAFRSLEGAVWQRTGIAWTWVW